MQKKLTAVTLCIFFIFAAGCASMSGGLIKEFDVEKAKTGEMTYSPQALSAAKIEITKLEGMGVTLAGVHGLSGNLILLTQKVNGNEERIRISIDAEKTSVSSESATLLYSPNKIAPQSVPLQDNLNERYRRDEPIVLTLKNNVLTVEMDGKMQNLQGIKEFTGVLRSENQTVAHVKVFKN